MSEYGEVIWTFRISKIDDVRKITTVLNRSKLRAGGKPFHWQVVATDDLITTIKGTLTFNADIARNQEDAVLFMYSSYAASIKRILPQVTHLTTQLQRMVKAPKQPPPSATGAKKSGRPSNAARKAAEEAAKAQAAQDQPDYLYELEQELANMPRYEDLDLAPNQPVSSQYVYCQWWRKKRALQNKIDAEKQARLIKSWGKVSTGEDE